MRFRIFVFPSDFRNKYDFFRNGWQLWHMYYPKFSELYSCSINSLIITALKYLNWTLKYGINCHFDFNKGILIHFHFFQTFSPYFDQLLLSRDTVPFVLKFFLSIWNFLTSSTSVISIAVKQSSVATQNWSCSDWMNNHLFAPISRETVLV